MKRLPIVISFLVGTVFGCFTWHFRTEVINRMDNHALTPQEEVERMMNCLEIGK